GRLDLALEMDERVVRRDAGPQRARVLAAELAHALELKREARCRYRRKRVVDRVGIAPVDLADEAQGDMKLPALRPARAGHARLHQEQAVRRDIRQREGDEQ